MVSMLECIRRIPTILHTIIDRREDTLAPLWERYGKVWADVDELVLIGSGTSNTATLTARYLAERASGRRVTATPPNEFLHSLTVRNSRALHVFVSQTGTSIVARQALQLANKQGLMTAAWSEAPTTPMARDAGAFLNLHCGQEEYPMRTIGYSASVLSLLLLGLELGRRRGVVPTSQYEAYIAQARAAANHIPKVIDRAMGWLDAWRRPMLRSSCVAFYGSDSLYGVALEAAVKVWETPQIAAIGYELEEGIHGPNYGFNHNHCVIVLNAGGVDQGKAIALSRYMRLEKGNGFLVGLGAEAPEDLAFEPQGGAFCCLEFAAVVQVLAFRLALDQGRDLYAPHDNSVMESYFRSHS